jgi:hypothetical protein
VCRHGHEVERGPLGACVGKGMSLRMSAKCDILYATKCGQAHEGDSYMSRHMCGQEHEGERG